MNQDKWIKINNYDSLPKKLPNKNYSERVLVFYYTRKNKKVYKVERCHFRSKTPSFMLLDFQYWQPLPDAPLNER